MCSKSKVPAALWLISLVTCGRESFEQTKYEENMKIQAAQLRPNVRKQV